MTSRPNPYPVNAETSAKAGPKGSAETCPIFSAKACLKSSPEGSPEGFLKSNVDGSAKLDLERIAVAGREARPEAV